MILGERIQRLQKHLGVSADGDVGPATVGAIERALGIEPPVSAVPAILPRLDEEFINVLIDIASKEVGTKEQGNNSGPRIREYQAATWLQPGAWPWCAAFVCWTIRETLLHVSRLTTWNRPQTAGAWDFENWGTKEKGKGIQLLKPRTKILRGDILVYTFSHIGMASADEANGFVATIEGNTNPGGGREGDGVYAKRRDTEDVRSHIRFLA